MKEMININLKLIGCCHFEGFMTMSLFVFQYRLFFERASVPRIN